MQAFDRIHMEHHWRTRRTTLDLRRPRSSKHAAGFAARDGRRPAPYTQAARTGQGRDVEVSLLDTAVLHADVPWRWNLNRGFEAKR